MPKIRPLTPEQIETKSKLLYHHVTCKHLKGLRISLTPVAHRHQGAFSAIGIASTETVRAGLKAVDASPFKTVFVVDVASGEVLFALSKNEDYVAAAKKKNPSPNPPPPPPPPSECCQLCGFMGGTSCQPLADGSCICFGADRGNASGDLDDELGSLTP